MLNLSINLDNLTAGQLAHLYLTVVKMGLMKEAEIIYDALLANCGAEEAVKTLKAINTVAC